MINKVVYFDYDDLRGKGIVVREENKYLVRLVGELEGCGHSGGLGIASSDYWWVSKNRCELTDNKLVESHDNR